MEKEEGNKPSERKGITGSARKLGAVVGVAFLGAIGSYLATIAIDRMEAANAGPSLTVRVVPEGQYLPASPLSAYKVIPFGPGHMPADVPEGIAYEDLWKLLAKMPGTTGSPQFVRLELRTPLDTPVVIRDVQIQIVARKPPTKGWFVAEGGCGPEMVRVADVDLDKGSSHAQFFDPDEDKPIRSFSVTRNDVEILELQAHSRSSDVRWVADVYYSSEKGSGQVRVDDHGQPFHMTTEVGSQGYMVGEHGLVRRKGWDNGISMC